MVVIMGSVGLLYVGAVLLVNGLMLLEVVPPRSAAVLNLFVGAMQCVLPTIVLIQSAGDPATILSASGVYLLGFTYLYVGIGTLAECEPQGIGWFSAFVAAAALVYAWISFGRMADPVFGVIWIAWALLWGLFFLVPGVGVDGLTRFTGWAAVLLSLPTCTVPALLALTGNFHPTAGMAAIWAAGVVAALGVAWLLAGRYRLAPTNVPAAS